MGSLKPPKTDQIMANFLQGKQNKRNTDKKTHRSDTTKKENEGKNNAKMARTEGEERQYERKKWKDERGGK